MFVIILSDDLKLANLQVKMMQNLRIALNYTYKGHGLIKDSRIAKTDAMGFDFKFVSCKQISYTGSHFQNKRIHKDQVNKYKVILHNYSRVSNIH